VGSGRRTSAGFTIVEVLVSVTVFIIAFLSGMACIAQLLLNQNLNYQHVVAGTGAMLLTDWHVRRAITEAPVAPAPAADTLDFITHTTSASSAILIERFSAAAPAWSNINFVGGEFAPVAPNADRVFTFSATPVTDTLSGALLDLSEYQSLVVTVSPAATRETDARIAFRQVSFWYLPANDLTAAIAGGYTAAHRVTARFVGRYLVPDQYLP
jgi:Tfp pilus assembly protein PilV